MATLNHWTPEASMVAAAMRRRGFTELGLGLPLERAEAILDGRERASYDEACHLADVLHLDRSTVLCWYGYWREAVTARGEELRR